MKIQKEKESLLHNLIVEKPLYLIFNQKKKKELQKIVFKQAITSFSITIYIYVKGHSINHCEAQNTPPTTTTTAAALTNPNLANNLWKH